MVDVLVAGGGVAGICAAAQAARAGARTLLIEKNGQLGGTATMGGVRCPGLFHAWGRPIIAGVGWELVERCVAEQGTTLPDFTRVPEHHWQHQPPLNRFVLAAVADELVVESGAELLFHVMPAAARRRDTGWRVELTTKTGAQPVDATVVVDATGDANLLHLAGLPLAHPCELQPATPEVVLEGYDPAALDYAAIESACAAAVADGRLRQSDYCGPSGSISSFLRQRGFNAIHIPGLDASTSLGRTAAELAGRQAVMRLRRFLRAQPGLERLEFGDLASECGIRETVTIHGEDTVTLADYVSGRVWPEALCYSFYPIDVHRHDGDGIDIRPLQPGVVPTIPRGALIPRNSHGLLAAGRCIASDHEANSALRVQASCMAIGQAAGALAALAARGGCQPRDVPLDQVRDLLRAHGAIVPGE